MTVSTDLRLKDGDFRLKWKAPRGDVSIQVRDNISKACKAKVKEISQVEVSLREAVSHPALNPPE